MADEDATPSKPTMEALAAARFASLSWVFKEGDYVSRYDSDFPLRPRIVFYAGDDSKLSISDAVPFLKALSKTNFPTPYSATSNRRPYWVEVIKNGETLYRLESCWGTPRCAAKEMFLSWLLGAPKKL